MSGVHRFLSVSKRDKDKDRHKHHSLSSALAGYTRSPNSASTTGLDKPTETVDATSPVDFYGLFFDKSKPTSKDEESKIKTIRKHIIDSKGVRLKDGQILWALHSQASRGDTEAACGILVAISDASEGILTLFNPKLKMRGAVNRDAVTCYLDSTLFSMFSRLDSFEAMLYNSFEDVPRQRLAFLLRLWVNLLRSGDLVPIDVTKEIQQSLAECGWNDAKELHQQDASEAFSFITEKLNLPLLTLKMDIYHTGRHDNDDHKFINERLLEVAIPTLPNGEHPAEIKLEDCLEEYFNNRIEVKRYLERRNTLTSKQSYDSKSKTGTSIHVEAIEIDPESSTPGTPLSSIPSYMSERPANRHRAPSIIQERYISDQEVKLGSSPLSDQKRPGGRLRTGSIRKEVLMPAWQFFSLIPWYTDHTPSNDAQVAAHFSSKRPILGLCLKRYSYTNTGRAMRLNTFVDVPIEIGLPHFIQDEAMDDSGPLYGNFKLSLQSAVCHRGTSVNSGHYISLVRSTSPEHGSEQGEGSHWLRFDDLASPRITLVDIRKALREETPYLLFYQILPVEGDPGNLTSGEKSAAPPSYSSLNLSESAIGSSGSPNDQPETLNAMSSNESRPGTRSGRTSPEMTEIRRRSTDALFDSLSARRPSAISFTEKLLQPRRSSLEHPSDQNAMSTTGISTHKKSGSLNSGLTRTFSKLGLRDRWKSGEDISTSSSSSTVLPPAMPQQQPPPPPLPQWQQRQQQQGLNTASRPVEEHSPEIHIDEVKTISPEQTHYSAQIAPPASTTALAGGSKASDFATPRNESVASSAALSNPNANPNASASGSGGIGRSRSKREKSRNRLLKHSGKDKDKDPDRECTLM